MSYSSKNYLLEETLWRLVCPQAVTAEAKKSKSTAIDISAQSICVHPSTYDQNQSLECCSTKNNPKEEMSWRSTAFPSKARWTCPKNVQLRTIAEIEILTHSLCTHPSAYGQKRTLALKIILKNKSYGLINTRMRHGGGRKAHSSSP